MLPKEDLFVIGKTNNTDLHSARQSSLNAPEDIITQMRSHSGFRATTTGGWRDNKGNLYIDHGVMLSTNRGDAMNWGSKWGQKSVMELDNRGPDLKVNFHDVAKSEESYNVGSQGIPSGNYPPFASMKPGYGGTPPDRPGTHAHYAGEFGQGKKPAATTTMDTEAYQKLRNRGLTDAQSRHALILMQSTGVPVEQLQSSGLMAIPQLGEEGGPGSGRKPSGARGLAALGIGGAAAGGIGAMAAMQSHQSAAIQKSNL